MMVDRARLDGCFRYDPVVRSMTLRPLEGSLKRELVVEPEPEPEPEQGTPFVAFRPGGAQTWTSPFEQSPE